MAPGASGPLHSVSNEQILVVTDGRLSATVGGSEQTLAAGDATILPAGVERRLANAADEPVVSLVAALSGGEATVPGKDPVPIPWAQ